VLLAWHAEINAATLAFGAAVVDHKVVVLIKAATKANLNVSIAVHKVATDWESNMVAHCSLALE